MASGVFERRYVDGAVDSGGGLGADSAQSAPGRILGPASETASLSSAAVSFLGAKCVYQEVTIVGRRGAGVDGPGQGSAVKPGPAAVDTEPLFQEARAPDPVSEGFTVTSYGESYNGSPLGCGGVYSSGDSSILAVGPANSGRWPCGAHVTVCGPTGACLDMVRVDSCPGCGATGLDTSESGYAALCGNEASGPCAVEVRG